MSTAQVAIHQFLSAARAWPLKTAKSYWSLRPRGVFHTISALVLWAIAIAYFQTWVSGNWAFLTDTALQTDDVRTALFPFHRYGPEGALAEDPIAVEMLAYIPLLVKAVFIGSVPWVGLFAASKVSQLVCLSLIVASGLVLMKHRRTGIATGLLLVMFFLRDPFVIDRMASGLPRGYGFPALALWTAGALAGRIWVRRVAIAIAALTYPSALAMALGAEGLLAASGFFLRSRKGKWIAARRLAITIAIALGAVSPALMMGDAQDGSVHSLAEAKKEPAFGKKGRLYILPFADSRIEFGKHFSATYTKQGHTPTPRLRALFKGQGSAIATASIAFLLVLGLVGASPVPRVAIAFFAGSSIIYLASRYLAFHLYSPERYYSYGMRAAGLLLLLNVVPFVGYRLSRRFRYPVRNLIAASIMLGAWCFHGDGIKPNNGLTISKHRGARLHKFVQTLPLDVLIASHPLDAIGVPYFAARATMGSYETLQPWRKGSWARQKERAEDTLRALYSTNPKKILEYAEKYGVTHFFIYNRRYRKNFRKKARTFEPFSSFTNRLLKDRNLDDMVFTQPPKSAIVYQGKKGLSFLLEVEALRKAWN